MRDSARPEANYSRVYGTGRETDQRAAADWVTEVCDRVRRDTLCSPETARDEIVLLRFHSSRDAPSGELSLRLAGPVDLDSVFDLWANGGSSIPSAAREARGSSYLDPRFPIHIASTRDGRVAMATTFYSNGIAWLGNTNTRAAFRRRRAHRSLLRARRELARANDASWILADTSPGSGSHKGALNSGFETLLGIHYRGESPDERADECA